MEKILFYINVLWKGGAERVILQLATKCQEEGYDVLLVTSFQDNSEYAIPSTLKRVCLEKDKTTQNRLLKNITRVYKLRKIIKEQRPNLLISFMAEPNFRAVIASLFLNTKVVISVRNDPRKEYAGFFNRVIAKYILPLADGCVFQTKDAMDFFPKRLQKKSKIIFNEVSEKFFVTKRTNVGNDIVTIGRVSEQKNQILLIKAFEELKEKYPQTRLVIYGSGNLEQELLGYINCKNLSGRVLLNGVTDDVPEVLAHAALFVLCSNYEGMPNVLLEAMAVGVPVISSDCPCGGPKMIIENGINGLLFPVNDKDRLREAIEKMLSDKEYAECLGNNARYSSDRFAPRTVFKDWQCFINVVLKNV